MIVWFAINTLMLVPVWLLIKHGGKDMSVFKVFFYWPGILAALLLVTVRNINYFTGLNFKSVLSVFVQRDALVWLHSRKMNRFLESIHNRNLLEFTVILISIVGVLNLLFRLPMNMFRVWRMS